MKKAGLLLLLTTSVTAQAATIQYDFQIWLEPPSWTDNQHSPGWLEGRMLFDSAAGQLTGMEANFTPHTESAPEFSTEWSGVIPLTVHYDVLGPDFHNAYMDKTMKLSNGDTFHMDWEAIKSGSENVFEFLHLTGEGYGTYDRANGESYTFLTSPDSFTLISQSVPEPGTLALLGVGLGLAGFRLKRRNP